MKKILLFLLMLLIPFTVEAKNEGFQYDSELKVKEDIDSSAFLAGKKIANNANINGISFMTGWSINDKGTSKYSFMAGMDLTVNSKIEEDLFIAGDNIVVKEKTIVGRDAYIFSNSLKLSGIFNRDINAYGDTIEINNATIEGNIYLVTNNIKIGENVIINGTLSYDINTVEKIDDSAQINKISKYNNTLPFKERLINTVYAAATSFIGILFVALTVNFFYPSFYLKIDKQTKKINSQNIFRVVGKGLLTFVLIPLLSIILLSTWFGKPLGIILLILYVFGIYFSTLIVSYVIGKKLWQLLKKEQNVWVHLLIGLACIYILKYTPHIGGWVTLIVIIIGLGFILDLVKPTKKSK